MNKTLALIAIVPVIIGGLFALGLNLFATQFGGAYRGHTGYCKSVELPGFRMICIAYLLLAVGLLLYFLVTAARSAIVQQAPVFRRLLIGCLALLLYPCYSICRFPYMDRGSSYALEGNGAHNPMFVFGGLFALVLLLVTARFQAKAPALKPVARIAYAGIAIFLLVSGLVFLLAGYETCFG